MEPTTRVCVCVVVLFAAAVMANVAEHRVQMPAGAPAGKAAAAAPEMGLNRFILFVVLIERLGNALGTLAFTWATVVLLGGYASELHSDEDFMFATILIFLEAARYVYTVCRLFQ